ncbi:MAG: LppA family lipoprotein [Mycobacterium sp.]|uniref:LppA family lipoprotein n=1 Tax=Mycobacterium sp. TaxID=1785 RepID=UPI002632FAFF|nr:LppA family lipoprotein [Mycobacterium sp.]MDI3314402.1 LppA family lipoprotein [Mycobacterium sp.]
MKNPYKPTDPDAASKAAATLNTLPSLEDTQTQLKTTIEQIGTAASAIAPTLAWHWLDEPSRGGCSPPYEQSDGQEVLMPNYVSNTPIPEENWQSVFDIARDAAAKLGANSIEVFRDAPGNHDVEFFDETGTTIRLGSQQVALISGSTGCRLPRDRK